MFKMCTCCSNTINYSVDDLPSSSQILPIPPSTHPQIKKDNNLFPTQNKLITFGNIPYDSRLDLNQLISKTNSLIKIESIAFGDTHSLMLISTPENKKTFLYGYGSNENGQLGINFIPGKSNVYNKWTLIKADYRETKEFRFFDPIYEIKDVCIGNKFSIVTIVDPDDKMTKLFRFSLKKEDKIDAYKTQDAKNVKSCVYKENIDGLEGEEIIQVEAFGDRVLVLTKQNGLYIKGTLYDLNIINKYVLYARFEEKIISMHLGINFCILKPTGNNFYCVGHNDYSEFGLEGNFGTVGCQYGEKTYIENNFFKDRNLKIVQISTGARHTLVLCSDGQVFAFGDNSDGACCGLEKIVCNPTKVVFDEIDNVFIVEIATGFNHSIAKDKSGKVYMWGDSAWGKLGTQETRTGQFMPVEVSEMKIRNVVKFFGGPMQSAFFFSGGFKQ